MKSVIIFEGPDMSGKTTQIARVAKKLNEEGLKVATFKFPVYDGIYGDRILKHLKETGDLVKNFSMPLDKVRGNAFDFVDKVVDYSLMNFANKVEGMKKLVELSKENDLVLVDRFTMSSFAYDLAWAYYVTSSESDEFDVNALDHCLDFFRRNLKFWKKICDRETKVMHYIMQDNKIDFAFIYFKHSRLLKSLSANDPDRKFDGYDCLDNYQEAVRTIYEKMWDANVSHDVPIDNFAMFKILDRIETDYYLDAFGDDHSDEEIKEQITLRVIEIIKNYIY